MALTFHLEAGLVSGGGALDSVLRKPRDEHLQIADPGTASQKFHMSDLETRDKQIEITEEKRRK